MYEVLGMFCVFGLPVMAFIISRVLKHQERIEMIRRGMMPSTPDDKAMWDSFARMNQAAPKAPSQPRPGASQQPFDPNQAFGYQAYMAAQNQLRKGITLGMIGLALFIGLSFIDIGRPGPWLLGGLIPMFVGIAQILIAMMSGARFGFGAMPGPVPGYQAPPSSNSSAPGPQASQPRDVTPGPYAYRPGNTTELEPPASPPDKRF